MKILFSSNPSKQVDAIAVGVYHDNELTKAAKDIDQQSSGAISRAIKASHFTGKTKDVLLINTPQGLESNRIVLVGLGDSNKINEQQLTTLGGSIIIALGTLPDKTLEIRIDEFTATGLTVAEAQANIAVGAYLRSWRFDKYRTQEKDEDKPHLKQITLIVSNPEVCESTFVNLQKVVEGALFARKLVTEPANTITPETLAEEAQSLSKLGVKVEVLGEKKLKALGARALLGVGQGSDKESQLVVMQWMGADKNQQPIAFVGKGVTFDSGGLSIKTSVGMEEMKFDMAGSGVVIGLMQALAGRKAKVNAIGVVGLVENMPSGTAQRPGDVVKSMSGQTIEILNTDAEGRLVLADALWYTQDRFKPQIMVNLATLTGAIIIALGHEYAGLFSNDDQLAKKLIECGNKVGEKVWRFPLHENYDKDIESNIADMKNIGDGRNAGSISAAIFLQKFVNKIPWAHLDIAGVAWSDKDLPISEKGATAFGVRLLDRLVRDHYEAA